MISLKPQFSHYLDLVTVFAQPGKVTKSRFACTGKLYYKVKTIPNYENWISFRYKFPTEYIDVQEEYLVIDEPGFIGSIGGTLGLFIGFSFRDLIFAIIDYLEVLCIRFKRH